MEMGILDRVKSHPIYWVSALMIISFVAGIKTDQYLYPDGITNDSTFKTSNSIKTPNVSCVIEGLRSHQLQHRNTIAELQKQKSLMEVKATDTSITFTSKDLYLASANRFRADIAIENKAFLAVSNTVEVKCEAVKSPHKSLD